MDDLITVNTTCEIKKEPDVSECQIFIPMNFEDEAEELQPSSEESCIKVKQEEVDVIITTSNLQVDSENLGRAIKIESVEVEDLFIKTEPPPTHVAASTLKNCIIKDKHLKPLKCDDCEFRAASKSVLNRHLKTHAIEKPHQCQECTFKTAYKAVLEDHMNKHTGEKPYECHKCDFKTAHKATLDRHIKTRIGDKPYQCEVCEFKTAFKSALNRHKKLHVGDKPHFCPQCKFRTAYKSALEEHMNMHTGQKPFQCKVCNLKTAYKSVLVKHLKAHTEEKQYNCRKCNFKTAHKFVLNQHENTHMHKHTSEKLFKSKICRYAGVRGLKNQTLGRKTFFQCLRCKFKSCYKTHVIEHMKAHTKQRPFWCKVCGCPLATRVGLTLHMQKVHNEEKSNEQEKCKNDTERELEETRDLQEQMKSRLSLIFRKVIKT